jgi:hypothetical protein
LNVKIGQRFVVRDQQFRTERRLVGLCTEMLEPTQCEELRTSAFASSQRAKAFDVTGLI